MVAPTIEAAGAPGYNIAVPESHQPETPDARRNGGARTPVRAYVASLKLADFRNYAGLTLALDRRSVVLTGQNGAGKTNLLEAVSFLSPGRGLRRAALEDVADKRSRQEALAPTELEQADLLQIRVREVLGSQRLQMRPEIMAPGELLIAAQEERNAFAV